MGKVRAFKYQPDGDVLREFMRDRSPVSIINGPVGSGTSTACCFKMWAMACEQRPDLDGYRRTRWVIVRNTYSDLKETTLKTWRFWFEEKPKGAFGEVRMSNPPHHDVEWSLPDGTTVKAEFIFLSLDVEEDKRKLLSMEMTGIWFNEAQFTEKAIFDIAHSRAIQGRYPPKLDGGPTWKGVIADLNAPPEGHWIPYMRGDIPMPDEWDDEERREYQKPDDWSFFVQPPGLLEVIKDGRVVGYEENPEAENMRWIDESYLALIKGKPKTWIDTYVMNRVGMYMEGRAVFQSFRPEIHVADEKLEYKPEWPLIVGLDFARNPAAVCMQLIRGVLYVLDEYGQENVSAVTFAPALKQRLHRLFPDAFTTDGAGIQMWGDPTGDSAGQGTDRTPYQIFTANGMNVIAAPGNNVISVRLGAIEHQLAKMVDGRPGLLISPNVRVVKAGMAGGYHFSKVKGQSRFQDAPYKNKYADYADALQYGALGAGLGMTILTSKDQSLKPQRVEKKPYSLRRRRKGRA